MNKKPYFVFKHKVDDTILYALIKKTSVCIDVVECACSFEELMIKIDLRGYDRNEIQFSNALK